MARIRTIKPEFFLNEELANLTPHTRLLFIGMWTLADRKGRLLDRPSRIAATLFPYEIQNLRPSDMLARLEQQGFISRYEVNGTKYIEISKFEAHQWAHHKEAESKLPGSANKGRT